MKRHYGIRTADFKLIHFYNDVDQWEMYDMTLDPKELNNIYDNPEYAAKREELHALLVEVQNEYGDTDPCEKVRVLYKGDRRNFDRTDK